MRVIFLDIDGCLNCQTTTQRDRGYIGIDPYKAAMFSSMVERVNAKVVLSSTWRLNEHSRMEVRQRVCDFIDVTPHMPISYSEVEKRGLSSAVELRERGYEIKTWLDAHPEVTSYAIIDDDSDMLPEQLPHFFKTTWAEGLTEEICGNIEEYFILQDGKCPACVMPENNGMRLHRNCIMR